MNIRITSVALFITVASNSLCFSQYYKEVKWEQSSLDEQERLINYNPEEKKRVIKNKIQSIECSEYQYSYGEPEPNGKKIKIKKYNTNGDRVYDWEPYESGTEIFIKYNTEDKLIESVLKDYSPNSQSTYTTNYSYDNKGNLFNFTKLNCMIGGASCSTQYEYNEYDKVIKELHYTGDKISGKYEYKYNSLGKCIEKLMYANAGSSESIYYKYDDLGNLVKEEWPGVNLYIFKYDSLSRRIEAVRNYKGKFESKTRIQYDHLGNIIEETNSYAEKQYIENIQPATETKTMYKFNELNQLSEKIYTSKGDEFPQNIKFTYIYNSAGEIVKEFEYNKDKLIKRTDYVFDDNNNILQIISNDHYEHPTSIKKFTYTYFNKRFYEVQLFTKSNWDAYKRGDIAGQIKKTSSGLRYIIHDIGVVGTKPSSGQQVSVHYYGMFDNSGKMFDNSFASNQPYQFPIGTGQVIPGWDEGIALLNKGARATFFIPSSLAYGEAGSPYGIPGNADLVFYVELVK